MLVVIMIVFLIVDIVNFVFVDASLVLVLLCKRFSCCVGAAGSHHDDQAATHLHRYL